MARSQVVAVAFSAARRAPAVLLLVLACMALLCAAVLLHRHVQEQRGHGAVSSPVGPTAAHADELPGAGRFSVKIDYTSLDAPNGGEVASSVVWDDAWFSHDAHTYNHGLARTVSVLAALAYSESGYYQAGSTQPPYMEDALAKLGFQDVSTESYRYRSEVVDEVLNLFTDDSDAVAYTLARKRLTDAGGAERDLLMVSVRGSYGSEWLSNLRLETPGDLSAENHRGYVRAAQEVTHELLSWAAASRRAGAEVSVLLVGHSRGGAIANLVAAGLDDLVAEGDASAPDKVFAYTFASPATTLSARAHDGRYGNIFNIANPSDIMPYLPLHAWGYERYGIDARLPAVDDEGFDAMYGAMRAAYVDVVGVPSSYDPADKRAIDAFLHDVSVRVPSVRSLMTPAGAASAVASCAAHIDPVRILYGHYPTVYIAWLDALDATAMRVG